MVVYFAIGQLEDHLLSHAKPLYDDFLPKDTSPGKLWLFFMYPSPLLPGKRRRAKFSRFFSELKRIRQKHNIHSLNSFSKMKNCANAFQKSLNLVYRWGAFFRFYTPSNGESMI